MKKVHKYYQYIYKKTEKLTRKLFNLNITDCLSLRYSLKKELEKILNHSVNDISNDEILNYRIGYKVAVYKTLCKILEVIEVACTLDNFTIQEYENEC